MTNNYSLSYYKQLIPFLWQTTDLFTRDKQLIPSPMTNNRSLFLWQSADPFVPMTINWSLFLWQTADPFVPMTINWFLFLWQSTDPFSNDNQLIPLFLWQSTDFFSYDNHLIPFPMTNNWLFPSVTNYMFPSFCQCYYFLLMLFSNDHILLKTVIGFSCGIWPGLVQYTYVQWHYLYKSISLIIDNESNLSISQLGKGRHITIYQINYTIYQKMTSI